MRQESASTGGVMSVGGVQVRLRQRAPICDQMMSSVQQ